MNAANDSVSDPSDWLPTSLSSFATLDSALRCQVCKEFYDTPMITSCSHTFCSLCIRRCLSSDGKCPTCRSEDQSSKLRRNWTVQECVDAFVGARARALELASVKETDDHPRRKRRKISGTHDHSKPIEATSSRQTRSSARVGGQKSVASSQEVIAIDSEDDGDLDFAPAQEAPEPVEPNDGLVACPMCNKRMKEESVFSHLDRCDGKSIKQTPPPPKLPQSHPSKSRSSHSRPISPAKHLPHLNYSLLKDGPLKKKLSELGIPTWGNRQLLIRRHTQWVDIYNANSDSAQPKSERQLLRELDTWERTQGGHAPGAGQTGPVGVMRKDFDGGEWTGRHKNQFEDLIAKAREKRRAAVPAAEEPKEEPKEEQKKEDDVMEGVVKTPSETPHTNGNGSTAHIQPPPEKPKIDTAKALPPPTSLAQEIQSSPVASMLHSAAQDVRRRSSISNSPLPLVPGLISTHSIPSASSTPAPSPQTNGNSRRTSGEALQNKSPSSLHQQDSLAEKMAEAVADAAGESNKMKTVDMFRVPESPINDVEGLGTAMGGG